MKTAKKTKTTQGMQAIVLHLNLLQLRTYLHSLHNPNP